MFVSTLCSNILQPCIKPPRTYCNAVCVPKDVLPCIVCACVCVWWPHHKITLYNVLRRKFYMLNVNSTQLQSAVITLDALAFDTRPLNNSKINITSQIIYPKGGSWTGVTVSSQRVTESLLWLMGLVSPDGSDGQTRRTANLSHAKSTKPGGEATLAEQPKCVCKWRSTSNCTYWCETLWGQKSASVWESLSNSCVHML